jgi:hypothetical protein
VNLAPAIPRGPLAQSSISRTGELVILVLGSSRSNLLYAIMMREGKARSK